MANLLSTLSNSELAALLTDASPDFIVLVSTSLNTIREKYGENSQKYLLGWKKVSTLLAEVQNLDILFLFFIFNFIFVVLISCSLSYDNLSQIQDSFSKFSQSEGVFHALLLDGAPQPLGTIRTRRSIKKRDFTDPVTPCYASLDLCVNGTTSCSGFGTCTLAKETTVNFLSSFVTSEKLIS